MCDTFDIGCKTVNLSAAKYTQIKNDNKTYYFIWSQELGGSSSNLSTQSQNTRKKSIYCKMNHINSALIIGQIQCRLIDDNIFYVCECRYQ